MFDRPDSNITPSPALPPSIQRASSTLKLAGSVGFWLQLFLGVISAVSLLFASSSVVSNQNRTSGIEVGIFCAVGGIVALGISIFFSVRYNRIAKLMQVDDGKNRPRKADILQMIRVGLIVNLVGMLVSIMGAEALVGIVLAKSLTVPQGAVLSDPTKQVNSIDLLSIQANTNTIAAHFFGICSSLWLLNRITK